jgi:hypothetical protein
LPEKEGFRKINLPENEVFSLFFPQKAFLAQFFNKMWLKQGINHLNQKYHEKNHNPYKHSSINVYCCCKCPDGNRT